MPDRAGPGYMGKEFAWVLLYIAAGVFLYWYLKGILPSRVSVSYFPPAALGQYFQAERDYGIPWYYFSAVDLQEKRDLHRVYREHLAALAKDFRRARGNEKGKNLLSEYKDDPVFLRGALVYVKRLQAVDKVFRSKGFPIDPKYEYSYQNDWGNERAYGGKRKHEGTDIMCRKGTPILSVGSGTIEKKGWNELGGWRIGVRGDDGLYYYYAHMARYVSHLQVGDRVASGEIIGYVGDSGYGPQGTTGKFLPHLHFGIYEEDEAVSPYPFLKAWEGRGRGL